MIIAVYSVREVPHILTAVLRSP